MRLTRVDVVKALLVSPLLVPLSTPADDNIFFQSDDKSFDVSLPATWTLQAEPAPRANPQHLFYVRASRSDGAAKLEMTCDFMEGAKNLDTLGTVTKVAQKYLPRSRSLRRSCPPTRCQAMECLRLAHTIFAI